MYNRLYTFLCENNILYEKQFGFQTAHSTDHAIIQLVNEISKSFEENKFTLGVFIDLSKAFDTVNHKILITKLKNYRFRNRNLKWFISYLSNRKQFISCDDQHTDMANITWRKHINIIENKISKNNNGLLYKAKFLLSQKCLKSIYFSFVHSCINYANIA